MLNRKASTGRDYGVTDKELRKLGRRDLLQMLVEQGRELRELKEEYAALQRELDDRNIKLNRAGSIAEAALQLNGVFEAAQAACRQYTDSVALLKEQDGLDLGDAEDEARRLLEKTEASCAAKIRQTEEICQQMLRKAKAESQQYWDMVYRKLQAASRDCAKKQETGKGSEL